MNGFTADPWGGQRAGFSATAQINRRDFGVGPAVPADGGGVALGEKCRSPWRSIVLQE